jgi:hypothetical protein
VTLRFCFVLLYWTVLFPAVALAQRDIPDDNLAYPVLVEVIGSNLASGFFLNTANVTYLVTAKHVLFDPVTGNLRAPKADLLSYPRNPKEKGRNLFSVNLETISRSGAIKSHPKEDVAVVRLGTDKGNTTGDKSGRRELLLLNEITATESAESGIVGVSLENVKKFDHVLIANNVIVFGYPTSLGLENVPQLNPIRPLLCRGIVAGMDPDRKSLVIDCSVYPGDSGGPVLQITQEWPKMRFAVIGVVAQFVPFDSKRLQGLPPDYGRSLRIFRLD